MSTEKLSSVRWMVDFPEESPDGISVSLYPMKVETDDGHNRFISVLGPTLLTDPFPLIRTEEYHPLDVKQARKTNTNIIVKHTNSIGISIYANGFV